MRIWLSSMMRCEESKDSKMDQGSIKVELKLRIYQKGLPGEHIFTAFGARITLEQEKILILYRNSWVSMSLKWKKWLWTDFVAEKRGVVFFAKGSFVWDYTLAIWHWSQYTAFRPIWIFGLVCTCTLVLCSEIENPIRSWITRLI